MSDNERTSLILNANTELVSPDLSQPESPAVQSDVLDIQHINRSYGTVQGVSTKQTTNDDLGIIQSKFKKRIGQRCKNTKHVHSVPLTTHHGPNDPRSYLSGDYESLDYDTIENDLILQKEARREYQRFSSVSFNRWFVCFLIGTITACVAAIVTIGIERLTEIKLDVVRKYMLKCLNKEVCSVLMPWVVWTGFNIMFCTIATFLVAFIEPVAAGSGIPEIKCYLNGIKVPRVVRIKTLLCKAMGIIAAVSGGLACGKEGPMVHSGAVIAAGVSQGRSTTLACDCKMFKDFRCDHVKRDFIACGAAAGVSAAFGAPIGGVLFALEEGASFWNQSLTWRIFFASLVSSFTLNTILSAYKGSPGDLSNPGLANFGLFEISNYEWFELLIFIVMGAFGGLVGALFNEINIQLSLFRLRFIKHGIVKVLEVLVVSLTTTAVGFCAMYFVEDCIYAQIRDNTTELYNLQMQCDSGKYNSLATLFLQSPERTVKNLLHAPIDNFSWSSLLTFSVIYYFMSVWTYGLAVPSGLFMPSLLTGAAYGRLIGVVLHMIAPTKVSDPGVYALIGAASFLGGVTRMTISLTVIIMEATRNITFGLPIMITLVTARFVGNYFNEGLYDEHINLKQVPMLPWDPPVKSFRLTAGNIKSTPVKCFTAIETVGRIVEMLKNTTHNGFPVVCQVPVDPDVNHFGQFMGLITRDQLILLLIKKAYFNEDTMHQFGDISVDDFRDIYPRYPDIEQVAKNIPESHLRMKVHLQQFINLSPYTCNESVSFSRIFNLFRSMGLRHLVIVNEDNKAVGMVTRKDLAKFRKWRKQGSSGVQQLGFVGQGATQYGEDCCHYQ